MGIAKYLKQAWKKPGRELNERMIEWRKQPVVQKLDKPTRLDRARNLGYKAKKGVVMVRVRVRRGGHKKPRPNKGRRTKRLTIRKTLRMNYKEIAERRAVRKYSNMEVLNSYWVGKDGMHYFYEVILLSRNQPEIQKDKELGPVVAKRNRVKRGLTSAGRKSRGLRNKKGKSRPSRRAHNRK
ncbi:MAG: 50S ribosomal protein L15e [Candidatus Nanoarchaeia archaeon]